jgi:hypothetical protein
MIVFVSPGARALDTASFSIIAFVIPIALMG